MPLPDYLNPNPAAARALTRILACMDPGLLCAWNGRSQQYEVWGRSRERGHAFLSAVVSPFDGRPVSPECYPAFILADLRARDRDPNLKETLEANARLVERAWEREMDEAGEMARYVAKAVAQESVGALRHGCADVMLGLENAASGRSKAPRQGPVFRVGR